MPDLKNFGYKNTDTMNMKWINQMNNFNDCLYEFRESATFIGFPDWDEFLVTPTVKPLGEYFQKLIYSTTSISIIKIKRVNGYVKTMGIKNF